MAAPRLLFWPAGFTIDDEAVCDAAARRVVIAGVDTVAIERLGHPYAARAIHNDAGSTECSP